MANQIAVRPILMSAPMVRALIAGRKTKSRRIVKVEHTPYDNSDILEVGEFDADEFKDWKCPYGAVGDLLYVRETGHLWSSGQHPNWIASAVIYKADNEGLGPFDGCRLGMELTPPIQWTGNSKFTWTPGIYMPRWASRLTLRLTDIRVERLQEISERDVIAEGIEETICDSHWRHYTSGAHTREPIASYASLWNSINGNGSWAKNEFVWALTFEVIQQNVDAVLRAAG